MKKKILVVDDKKVLRETLVDFLGSEYDILEAEHGEKALELYSENDLDLVLLDENLPGIDGLRTLELMKKIKDSVPVIGLTGELTVDMRNKLLEAGCVDVQAKSAIYEKLIVSIQNAMAGKPENVIKEKPLNYEEMAEKLKTQGRWEEAALYLKEAGFEAKVLGKKDESIHLYEKAIDLYKRAGRKHKAKDIEEEIKILNK